MSHSVPLSAECACQEQGHAAQARAWATPMTGPVFIPKKSVLMETIRYASVGAIVAPLGVVAGLAVEVVFGKLLGIKLPSVREMTRETTKEALVYGGLGALITGIIGAWRTHQHNVNAENANREALFHQVAGSGRIQR